MTIFKPLSKTLVKEEFKSKPFICYLECLPFYSILILKRTLKKISKLQNSQCLKLFLRIFFFLSVREENLTFVLFCLYNPGGGLLQNRTYLQCYIMIPILNVIISKYSCTCCRLVNLCKVDI